MFSGRLAVPRLPLAWLFSGASWQSLLPRCSRDAAREGLGGTGTAGSRGRDFRQWDGKGRCGVPASPPGTAGANGIRMVIRELIYQPLMGSGKIEFPAICSWGGIQSGAALRSRVRVARAWQSRLPRGVCSVCTETSFIFHM